MAKLIFFVIGGILGLFVGAVAMLVAFPYLFPPDEVNETVTSANAEALYSGSFTGSGDGVHEAMGDVKVYREAMGQRANGKTTYNYHIELQSNFESLPGPNYYVYFNSAGADDNASFLADADRKRLAKLKSFKGSQVYTVTAEDFADATQVSIWCESFDQFIAGAPLSQ